MQRTCHRDHPPARRPCARRRPGSARRDPLKSQESPMAAKRLTLQQRREIFHALVATQDLGVMSVPQSVQHVMQQYDITESQLRQIEDEGIDKEWPPLDGAVQKIG